MAVIKQNAERVEMDAKELTKLYGTASDNIINLQKRVDYLERLTEKLCLRLDDAEIDIKDVRDDINRLWGRKYGGNS